MEPEIQVDDVGSEKPRVVQKDLWSRKYEILKRKCEDFEQLNEALFHRAKRIHQMIERAETEKRFLLQRLELYEGVGFPKSSEEELKEELPSESVASEVKGVVHKASAPPPALLGPFLPEEPEENGRLSPGTSGNEMPVAYVPAMPNSDHRDSNNGGMTIATPKSNGIAGSAAVMAKTKTTAKAGASKGTAAAKQKRAPKTATNKKQKKVPGGGSRRRKADTDPNQPKKPSNAFFWFCQEHRPSLQERFRGEGVQGQHDLTKILAKLWSETTPEDKKRYYELYAVDKKRYDRQMQDYVAKGQRQQFAKLLADSLTGSELSGGSADQK